MVKIPKADLVERIYNRLNGAVSRMVIRDVVNVVVDYIRYELKKDRSFSVKNFGTFSPYIYKGSTKYNIHTKDNQPVKSFRHVKFLPHASFRLLLNGKRANFKKSVSKNSNLQEE